jgi:hypothetical protein
VHAPLAAVDAALTAGPESAASRAIGAPVTDDQRVGDHSIVVPIPPATGIRSGSVRLDLRSVPEGTEITATSEVELTMLMRPMLWLMGRLNSTFSNPVGGLLDPLIPELEVEAIAIGKPTPT